MFTGALVDASNVCHDNHLPPTGPRNTPAWERLPRLIAAWAAAYPSASVTLVADNSLKHMLGLTHREWRLLRDEFGVIEARVADDVILDRASRDPSLAVLSRDKFVNHRRSHSWIARQPERFLVWTVHEGRIGFTRNEIIDVEPRKVSRAIESKELLAHGLDARRHRRILTTRWRCSSPSCLHARMWADQLFVWPRVTPSGAAVCPGCETPLEPLGPSVVRQLVIEATAPSTGPTDSGDALTRIPLQEGVPVTLGRGAVSSGVDLRAVVEGHDDVLATISRQHVLLRLGSQHLSVTDLASRNGTAVARFVDGHLQPPVPLEPEVATSLGELDWLILGRSLQLRLSGTRFSLPSVPQDAVGAEAGTTEHLAQD
jgi:hypothetical protein